MRVADHPARYAAGRGAPGVLVAAFVAVLIVVAPVAVAAVAAAGERQGAATAADTPARRMLVISVPGLTWADIAEHDLPHLDDLASESGVANLSVRVERLATTPGDGYATFGAGTRSYGPFDDAAAAYDLDEESEAVAARDEFARRTGRDPGDAAIGVLGVEAIADVNARGLFEGTPGFLGDTLRDAGVTAGVVGNADIDPFGAAIPEVHREVALGLMTSDGTVPCGSVSTALLRPERASAFGARFDNDLAVAAYKRCRAARSVVLVEAPELRRERALAPFVSSELRETRRAAALRSTDELVGALLAVAGTDDAVMLIAPVSPGSDRRLMVFAVRAGVGGIDAPGILVSSSTRQAGYVTLGDAAPTVAAIMGIDIDEDEIEGRPVSIARRQGDFAARLEFLVDGEAAARFRDDIQAPVIAAFITLVSVFSVLIAMRYRFPLTRRIPRRLLFGYAATILTIPPLTYIVAALPMHEWGRGAYSAFVFGGAIVIGGVLGQFHRRWLLPLTVPLVLLLVVVFVSVVLFDSRLQLSAVFGDSPIIAGRFTGINNATFATIIAAAIMLGGMLLHALERRRAIAAMLVLFGAVVVVDVAPMWGADVGGILAGFPSLAVAAILLAGWRLRWRVVALIGLAVVGAAILIGLYDLSRDPVARTHLGRLFERIRSDGISGISTMVNRKLRQNLRTFTGSIWRYVLVPVLASAVALGFTRPRPLIALRARFAPIDRTLAAIAIAGVLGYAVNDSGIAIPGMMLAMLAPVVGSMLLHTEA